ncbi:hypothetical protein CAPTEDRAFT_203449 [Capitella teleta]|uniref:Fork-head domain-containing protein n=1 Tax=Capitella teleta TaxID=283909 RepID=R7TT46_CAPTE|nr:hypothetical protein CAPTEDRAFT_203449 [Capitella teleta]|eukprot:ELT94205.1 hypothetical protein CAPTEDRAFT_203449 [Capitella teleta]
MESINQSFGNFQHFIGSLPPADCAFVNPTRSFGTSRQLYHHKPAAPYEKPLFSQHQQQPQMQECLYQEPQYPQSQLQQQNQQPQLHQFQQVPPPAQHQFHPYRQSQLHHHQYRHQLQQPQPQQYPQLQQLQQSQLQQQQQLAPIGNPEEASPVTGDSLIRMAFTLATEDQSSVEVPQQPQTQAQSALLPAVHAPPTLQQQISKYPTDVIIAPLELAAALLEGEQQNPVPGAAVLIPDAPKTRGPLPATGSFGEHIGRAFAEAESSRLHLHDLYEYFLKKFGGLDPEDRKWRSSIRNKLSASECFVKGKEKVGGKRGGRWSVSDEHLEEFRNNNFHSTTVKKTSPTPEKADGDLSNKSNFEKFADVLTEYPTSEQ